MLPQIHSERQSATVRCCPFPSLPAPDSYQRSLSVALPHRRGSQSGFLPISITESASVPGDRVCFRIDPESGFAERLFEEAAVHHLLPHLTAASPDQVLTPHLRPVLHPLLRDPPAGTDFLVIHDSTTAFHPAAGWSPFLQVRIEHGVSQHKH